MARTSGTTLALLLLVIFSRYMDALKTITTRSLTETIEITWGIGPECFSMAGNADSMLYSIGYNVDLCVDTGFVSQYCSASQCGSRYVTDVASTATELFGAFQYCSDHLADLPSSGSLSTWNLAFAVDLCRTEIVPASIYASIDSQSLKCHSLFNASSTGDGCKHYFDFWNSQINRALTASVSRNTTTSDSPPTETSISPAGAHTMTTSAVAGVAVGAAVGGMLLFAFVTFFIWRHRRVRMRVNSVALGEEEQPRKAQLHSDSHEPTREELQGTKVPRGIREIGGLNEIEYTPLMHRRPEMCANETTALELGSDSNPLIDWLALLERSEAKEEQRGPTI